MQTRETLVTLQLLRLCYYFGIFSGLLNLIQLGGSTQFGEHMKNHLDLISVYILNKTFVELKAL